MSFQVLVAGHTGQVAQCLAVASQMPDVHVQRVGRPELDITNRVNVEEVIAACQPDLVINAAAYTAVDKAETEPDQAAAVNTAGAAHLAAATAHIGVPLFHLSTDYVFNGTKVTPYKETDPVSPLGVYGRTKLDGEVRVMQENPQSLILRTSWVYSPFGHNFVKTMLRLAATKDEIGVVSDQTGVPTSGYDIAGTLLKLTEKYRTHDTLDWGTYHMVGGGQASWADLAEAVFAQSAIAGGPRAKVARIMTTDYPTPAARPANSVLGTTKLKETFGVSLPDWKDSLAKCVDVLMQKGSWQV